MASYGNHKYIHGVNVVSGIHECECGYSPLTSMFDLEHKELSISYKLVT